MKKVFTLLFICASVMVTGILFYRHSDGPLHNSNLNRVTGAPGESNCTACHVSFPNNGGPGNMIFTISGGFSSYIPGQTYTLQVQVTGSGANKYGFQMTSLTTPGNVRAGTFTPASNTDTFKVSNRHYIEHNQNNASGIWNIPWKAPSTDVGNITIYVSGCAGEFPTGTQTDHCYTRSITLSPAGPPLAAFTQNATTVCQGDTVTFTDQSVNASTLQWSFPGGSPSSSGLSNPKIAYNTAGTYTVELIAIGQAGNDTVTKTNLITVNASPVITGNITNPGCSYSDNGTIDVSVSSGTPGYTYNWSTGSSSQDISGLECGTYVVTVTDSKGCSTSKSFSVTCPPDLNLTITKTALDCYGDANASAAVSVTGGSPPYGYEWSTGSHSASVVNLPGGAHYITVTDNNGCTAIDTADIFEPLELSIQLLVTPTSTQTASDGSIDAVISGGTQPYTYKWSNGPMTQDNFNLSQGTYTITVTDANNCIKSKSALVDYNIVGITQNRLINSIYPNPVTNYLRIMLDNLPESARWEMVDAMGRTILSDFVESTEFNIDISALAPGNYWFRIISAHANSQQAVQVIR